MGPPPLSDCPKVEQNKSFRAFPPSKVEVLNPDNLVLLKAQLGEPFLEIQIIFLQLFHLFFRQNWNSSPQNRHLSAQAGT